MRFEASNCIAVGVSDSLAAERFYVDTLGFEVCERGACYVELRSGALRLFLCDDEDGVCFDLPVDDVPSAAAFLSEHGCKILKRARGEVFVVDPYGIKFCISQVTEKAATLR